MESLETMDYKMKDTKESWFKRNRTFIIWYTVAALVVAGGTVVGLLWLLSIAG